MDNKWIDIEKTLPDWDDTVLIYKPAFKLNPGATGRLHKITKHGPVFIDGNEVISGITRWMNLPPYPEE